jgi:hypothetical protein
LDLKEDGSILLRLSRSDSLDSVRRWAYLIIKNHFRAIQMITEVGDAFKVSEKAERNKT